MNVKPAILILIDCMGSGGIERQVVELLKGLRKRTAFRVILAVLNPGGKLEAEAKDYVDIFLPVRRKISLDIILPFQLLYWAEHYNVQIVHSFGWLSSWLGVFISKILHIPCVNAFIQSAPITFDRWLRRGRWGALHSEVIVANSYAGLRAFHLDQDPRSLVIYNGVDLHRFAGYDNVIEQPLSICMVANFSGYKDHATLIQAFARVHQQEPQARLILVGADAGTWEQHHHLVIELGLRDSVEYIHDCIHPEPIIARSSICVLSSFSEGLSNSIIEYMALGKPVVATDSGGTNEIVDHEITGYLVPLEDTAALAEALLTLLRADALRRSMGEAGRTKILTQFGLDRMIDEYVELYRSL